jgi:hypothetical protein
MTKPTRPTVAIVLQPVDDDVPLPIRVRSALKTLLRCHRLRCIEVRSEALRYRGPDAHGQEQARETP